MEVSLDPDAQRMVNLALGQNRVLAMIAIGAPLREILDALLRFLEKDTPDMACSVLLLDPDGVHMHPCSAPSLPPEYSRALEGVAIGPSTGSCGTAAWRRERVIVSDIESDPLWADYRELARAHGLRACWSTPILDADAHVLGTFAMYFRQPRSPEAVHQSLIEIALQVAAIAIVRERREQESIRAAAALNDSEERYRLINLATKDAVWDWDLRGNTLWWNNGVESLFGYPVAEVPDDLQWWVDRVHPEDRERTHDGLHAAAAGAGNSWDEEYRFLRRDGSYADVQDRGYVMRDNDGTATRMIGMMQDISERKRAQARIRDLAYYEPVTRLPNRTSLLTQLAQAIDQARNGAHELALLLLNLDYFRDINDTLGHYNGDLLLQEVAARLRSTMEGKGQVAGLGGDEFAILLERPRGMADVEAAIRRIHACVQAPMQIAGIPLRIEGTLGVARYPEDGSSVDLLWQHADVALHSAKERREAHAMYSCGIDHYDPARLALLGELRDAVDAGQLILHYQPKVDLRTGRTVGVEALVRWQHPVHGLIYPDSFLPLAERTGLINSLTVGVIQRGLREGGDWQRKGCPLGIAINLSARNLHDAAFCDSVLGLVRTEGFPVAALTLEVTESAIMTDPVRAKNTLAKLHDAGIHLAMDDFGIGQSSLSYLKDLPIDKMKIDKSFVMDFNEPRNAALVRSAIDLAHNLGLEVTAEGVEDEATFVALRELGCDLGQGYFFSKPLPEAQCVTWLCESRWKIVMPAAVPLS